jgi:uncharacterized protein YbcI
MSLSISEKDPRAAPHPEGGELLASISRRIVQLLAQHAGKGPTKCKTHWAGPNILVVVRGGYTEAERTLYERGRAQDVRAYRDAIQDALGQEMGAEVEKLTGRKVVAFMSTSHQEPDLQGRDIRARALSGRVQLDPRLGAREGAGCMTLPWSRS